LAEGYLSTYAKTCPHVGQCRANFLKEDKMKKEYEIKEELEKILEQIKLKAKNCGDTTKEDRARKGAYIDCILILRENEKENANSEYPLLAEVLAELEKRCYDTGENFLSIDRDVLRDELSKYFS
jgi:hypothetical protein